MAVDDIDRFEKKNGLVINVYSCNEVGRNICPRRISKRRSNDPINLLMLENDNGYHYVLIKDLNKLLGNGNSHSREFCPYCCWGFDKRSLEPGQMEKHMAKCFTYGGTKVKMPDVGDDILEYTQYYKQQIAPFCIYADFESIMKKESEKKMIHDISGYSLCVVSPYEEPQIDSYRGADAGKVFTVTLESLGKELNKKIKNADAKMVFTDDDKEVFKNATHCHICEVELPKNSTKIDHLAKIKDWLKIMGLPCRVPSYKEVKNKMNFYDDIPDEVFQDTKAKLIQYLKVNNKIVVRDHCHWTGEFRGAAHQHCNLMYRKTYKIPCFFHNFTGYDSHHLFLNISSLEKTPTVVAKNMEKFISMDLENIRVQDSLQFLNYSLNKLVSNLKEKGEKEKKKRRKEEKKKRRKEEKKKRREEEKKKRRKEGQKKRRKEDKEAGEEEMARL